MNEHERPAIPAMSLPAVKRSLYPEPFRSRMGDRVKRRLGEAFGLTHYGVNLVELGPGAQSALRHWHTLEDELVYVLSGELVLITNAGEQVVTAGMCVGFPAGATNAHHLVNRSDQPASYLEIGDRAPADQAHYPDDDLLWLDTPAGRVAGHKDGTPY
jgi:uncharacterized cupin superfamily protein